MKFFGVGKDGIVLDLYRWRGSSLCLSTNVVFISNICSRRYICSYDIPLSAPLSPRCTLSTKNIQKRVEELRRFQLKASMDFRCTTYVNERAFTVVEFVDCDREAGGAARDPSAYSQYRAPRHLKDRKA